MTVQQPLASAPAPTPERRWSRVRAVAPWIGFGWMAAVLVLGITLAARVAGEPLLGDAFETFWTESFVNAAVITYAVVALPTLLVWLLNRELAVPVAVVAAAAVVLTVGDATGSLPALAVVAAQTVLAWFVGLALVSLFVPRAAGVTLLARTAIAFAVGNGLLGLVYLGLGSFGLIGGPSIVAVSIVLIALAVMVLLRRGWPGVCWPQPFAPSFLELVLVALALAFATWALLHGFAVETLPDTVRHHLPITRAIWEGGSTPELAWWTSRYPIHAQLVTVPAWAVGGSVGVSLSHAVVGLVAALGAAALAELLAGRRAAAVAFAAFVATPLFLWEIGHSYVDLYPAMFMVTAAVGVVLWQRLGPTRILVLAGFLAGLAFASKTTAATGVGALGLAVILVGRERFSWRSRLGAGLAVAGGGLLVAPWLWRSFQITGTFPGLELLTSTLLGAERDHSTDLGDFGVGRGPLGLLSIPWRATFEGELFGQNGAGALGVLLLMAVPLVVYAPRTRALAFTLVTVGIGAIAWAFTAQYLRYSLPLVALMAALSGVGVASLGVAFAKRRLGWMSGVVMLLVAVAVVLTAAMSLPAKRNQVPFEFYSGELGRAAMETELVPAYEVLQTTGDIAGPGTPVMWVGGSLQSIYTEAFLSQLRPYELGETDAEISQTLEDEGIEYLIWQLDGTVEHDWAERIVSPAYLRRHSELVMVSDHTYLFRLDEDLGWEQGSDILPRLEAVGPAEDWIPRAEVVMGEDGVTVPAGGNIKAAAPVEARATYIVRVRGSCENEGDMNVFILWKDENGVTIDRDRQRIIPPHNGPTFILTTAVDEAESAIVHLAPRLEACTVSSATMRELLNAP